MRSNNRQETEVKESDIGVSPELSIVIDKLNVALFKEFGLDHAFTIMGKGHIVAASNYKHGKIDPKIKD